jgi:hypothetical protein
MWSLNMQNRHLSSFARQLAMAAFAVSLASFSAAATAQQSLLPAGVVTASSLGEPELKTVRDAIAPQVALLSGAADKIGKARDMLLSPIATGPGNPTPSVPFRLRYAEELAKALEPVIAGTNQMAKINALVIAGELGTGEAARLVSTARKDTDASVRFQAADATKQIVDIFAKARGSALLDADEARKLLDDTMKAMASEKDPLVIDAMFATFETALASQALQESALKAISDSANALVRTTGNAAIDTRLVECMQRVSTTLQDLLNRGGQMTAASKISAADFGGSVLWHTSRAIQSKAIPGGEAGKTQRDAYARMARGAENLVILAGKSLSPGTNFASKGVDAKIRQGNNQGDAASVQDASDLMAMLGSQPFGVGAARYK